MLTGQQRIEEAKVRTYWETGRLIGEHLGLHAARADYGAEIVPRLETDLGINQTVLYRCIRFAQSFPKLAARSELSWAHYRLLIQIDDRTERSTVAAQAAKGGWTSRELEQRVRFAVARVAVETETAPDPAAAPATTELPGPGHLEARPRPLVPKRGSVGTHRLVAHGATLAVDLGFTAFRDLADGEVADLKAGEFVRIDPRGRPAPAPDARSGDLYTYRATVLRVVDGDTLWLEVMLDGRYWLKQKVRLRGLDCPEMDTAEGKAAKRFVEVQIARAARVVVTTTKPDKYDRYLSDVFLEPAVAGADDVIFLNNALLENGHAARKESYAIEDWEKGGAGVPK